MKLYLTVLLICISLVANDWAFFHRFVGHLYTFWGEISIQVLCPHFHGVVCLFVIEMCSLDIMDIRPFSDMWLANILFSQFGLSSPFCVRKLDFEIYYFSSTTFLESCHRGQDLIPKFSCQWPSFILPLVSPPDHMSTPSVGMAFSGSMPRKIQKWEDSHWERGPQFRNSAIGTCLFGTCHAIFI